MPLIPIPLGTHHTAKMTAQSLRSGFCLNCQFVYMFLVTAKSSGSAMAPLFIDQIGAQARAQDRAENEIRRRLDSADLVPCPKCGMYNRSATGAANLATWGWLIFFAAPFFAMAGSAVLLFGRKEQPLLIVAGILLALTPICIALGGFMVRHGNPNRQSGSQRRKQYARKRVAEAKRFIDDQTWTIKVRTNARGSSFEYFKYIEGNMLGDAFASGRIKLDNGGATTTVHIESISGTTIYCRSNDDNKSR